MHNPTITAADNRKHGACYSDSLLAILYDRPYTLREVLTNQKGEWAKVSNADRLWITYKVSSDKLNRLFACWCAEQCKPKDPRSIRAIEVAKRYANGLATIEELREAKADASYVAAVYAAAAYAAAAADATYAAYAAADAYAASASAAAYAADAASASASASKVERKAQCDQIRLQFGNPFKP